MSSTVVLQKMHCIKASLAWQLCFCASLRVSQQDTMSACQRANGITMSLPVSEVHAVISVKHCTTPGYSPCVYGKLSEAQSGLSFCENESESSHSKFHLVLLNWPPVAFRVLGDP